MKFVNSTLKRLIAVLLTLALVFGSTSDLFAGIAQSLAFSEGEGGGEGGSSSIPATTTDMGSGTTDGNDNDNVILANRGPVLLGDPAPTEFTITFVNADGTVLQSSIVASGETPVYNGDAPTKAPDDLFTYTFNGWDKAIVAAEEDATYTATFNTIANFTITWTDNHDEVLKTERIAEGSTPSYTAPNKADYDFTYTFDRWSPAVVAVTEDAVYKAVYTATENVTVTWKDHDGSTLADSRVPKGTVLSVTAYPGDAPIRPSDQNTIYTFSGWSPALPYTVNANTVITAQYAETTVTQPNLLVIWKDWDETVLKTEYVANGTTPSYGDTNPTREPTNMEVYTFNGWDLFDDPDTGTKVYTAKYTTTTRKYKIVFANYDGTVLQTLEYQYNETPAYPGTDPTRPDDEGHTYKFHGWTPAIEPVTKDATYVAAYTSTLQQLIADKLAAAVTAAAGSALKDRVTIILNRNTQYEGDVVIDQANMPTYDTGFGIDLVAEDAGDDGLQADGTINVIGALTIKGISVLLKGITVSGKVTLEGANSALDYYGTKSDEKLDVKMDANSTVNIQTGEGADTVTAEQAGGTLSITTGAGNDTVTAKNNGGTLTIDTGDDDDKVDVTQKADTGAANTVTVDTGAGNDTVTAKTDSTNAGTMSINTGAGEDNVTVENNRTAVGTAGKAGVMIDTGNDKDSVKLINNATYGNVLIKTGDANDIVVLDARTVGQGIDILTGAGNDTISIANTASPTDLTNITDSNINVDAGSGVNEITIDVNTAKGAKDAQKININSLTGNDHLHITGDLDTETAEANRATGNVTKTDATETDPEIATANMTLIATGGKGLNIVTKNVESITDDLKNKQTVILTPTFNTDGMANDMTFSGAKSFTNYVINAPSSKLKNVTIAAAPDQTGIILSNLIINTDVSVDDHKLVLGENSVIDAEDLSLVLQGKNIEINGIIRAAVVQLEAKDGTGAYSTNLFDQYAAYRETENVNVAEAGLNALGDMVCDLINISDKASIIIGSNAKIYSGNDVILNATVEQSGSLISGLTDTDFPINLVNVKIADAIVDIQGQIYAGYDFTNSTTRSDFGSVRANATVKTTMGIDKDGHMQDGYPLAVNVAYTNAKIKVARGAVIEAAKDINLASKSELKVATRADSGFGGAPAAVAVAVLINNASTIIGYSDDDHNSGNTTLHAKSGNVSVTADASTDAKTLADKNKGHDSKSGGFVAVSVVLQDALAEIRENAVVTAGGNVTVKSNGSEKVENTATSAQQKSEEKEDNSVSGVALDQTKKLLSDYVWPKIKEKITEPTEQQKLDKALKSIGSNTHSAQVDEDAERYGEVTISEEKANNVVTYTITVKPWPTKKVTSVTWRGYNAGSGDYQHGEATAVSGKTNVYTFEASVANVIVSVDYADGPEEQDSAAVDLFGEKEESEEVDLQALLDDLNNGTSDDGKELDEAIAQTIANTNIPLTLKKDATGAVLTYDTEPVAGDNTKLQSLTKVAKGDKIRLLPNPAANYKLKDGSLKVVYSVKGTDDQITQKTIVVNKDNRGRYYFTVPEDIYLPEDQQDNYALLVKAEFEPTGESDKKADETSTAVVGAIGVVVADNDSQAIIRAGATVTAGKKADVLSNTNTSIANTADGSPINEKKADSGDKKEEKKEGEAVKRPASQDLTTSDPNMKNVYGLIIDETINGTVTATKIGTLDDNKTYAYKLDFTPATKAPSTEGGTDGYTYSLAKVLIIYYSKGERKTKEITADTDGIYKFDLTTLDPPIDKGSTARISVSFAYATEDGVVNGEAISRQSQQNILSNPIKLSYNVLNGDTNMNNNPGFAGHFYYEGITTETVDGVTKTYYKFKATPISSKGFTVKDKGVTATWKDASGAEKKVNLTYRTSDGRWYLEKTADIPAGAEIVVNCKFEDDFHEFKVGTSTPADGGTITLFDKQLKKGETAEIVVKPKSGYSVGTVTVSYTKVGTSGISGSVEANKVGTNLWKFTVKGDVAEGSPLTVSATFNEKQVGINYKEDEETESKIFTISDRKAAKKDTVTITLTADQIKAGKKIKSVEITTPDGAPAITKTTIKGTTATFTIPDDDAANGKRYTVKVSLTDKDIALAEVKTDNGTITPATSLADWNELVTVTVKPKKDFRIKSGSLKAVVKAKDGSFTEEIPMSRTNDTTYTFTMPAQVAGLTAGQVEVTLTGEFEPGNSDSSALETSLGAAIAVTVANSESRAEIKGTGNNVALSAGGDVNVKSDAKGGATTKTKAGYSKGNIGIGGAVTVQISSMDSKALIHDGATVKLDGSLNVQATSDLTFGANADASGSKEAKKVGVGAGIAVAVDGADAFAAVHDRATVSNKTENKKIIGISVVSNQKVKDTVGAKAGASGGTAVVPVAAVDVIGVRSEAYMGKVKHDNDDPIVLSNAEKEGNVSISAVTSGDHTITADATATGKGVGVGAAIAVSVIFDTSKATLNQSVAGRNVAVSSETTSKVSETATASAAGGKKEGDGGKNPDKQANSLTDTAAKMAGKNKSSSVDAGKISKATKDRQSAETSEGTVGVAGAIAVNVQFSESLAEIKNSVNVKASELLSVTSQSGTTSKVKANASTTNSDIGVGVGVAINIVYLDNIAKIGDGKIEAAILKVAATTKMTEPKKDEKKDTKKSTKTDDELAKELGEKVKEFINDLAREIGLYDYLPDDVLGKIIGQVVTATINQLLNDTGLSDMLGNGNWDAKYQTAVQKLKEAKDGLLGLPEQLFDPIISVIKDTIELDNHGISLAKFKEVFLRQLENQGDRILKEVKEGIVGYLKDNIADILGGLIFEQNGKDQFEKIKEKAKEYISLTFKSTLKSIVADTIRVTLAESGISEEDINRAVNAFNDVKDAYKKESMDDIFTKAVQNVTETFRKNVFDYEVVISKIANTDFKKTITTTLKNAAKTLAVTLTNGAISALSEGLDVGLEPGEQKATGHVIDTQAMAGAGARDIGIAGSVALTVLNGSTSATIANGSTPLTVTQDTTITADDNRSVHNVASAAVDAKGKAASNKKADKESNGNVGGGNDAGTKASGKHVSMETAEGASVYVKAGDDVQNKPRVYIQLKDGYKFDEKDGKPYAEYNYTNKDGYEVIGTIELKQDSETQEWYADAKQLTSLDDDVDVAMSIKPVEVLNTISNPDVLKGDDVTVEADAISIKVKDREQEKDKPIVARAGETVEIHIKKNSDRKIVGLGFSYINKNGERQDKEFMTYNDVGKEDNKKSATQNAFILATSNENEIVYSFTVPTDIREHSASDTDPDVGIVIAFEKTTEEDKQKTDSEAKTQAKDDTGKSVGVGAAFSMVYGDNSVTATIGQRTITSSDLTISASTDHKEDIAATAGSDPMGGTDENQIKDTSVDASVALNLLDNKVNAGITGASSNVTVNTITIGEGEAAVTKPGDLVITAVEKSITQTTSSAFAVGGQTAVGATAAINIADTEMKVNMDGIATVAGSATVTANSHSEDTTRALATAMGADIARNMNKLNQKTDSIEEGGNNLLSGKYVDGDGSDASKNKNKTQTKINKKLEDKGEKKKNADGTESTEVVNKTGSNNSTSSNALRAMNVKAEDEGSAAPAAADAEAAPPAGDGSAAPTAAEGAKTGTKDSDVTKALEEHGGKNLNMGKDGKSDEQKQWQVAAAVGVTVASHLAEVKVGRIVTTNGGITVGAENTGNFNTMGTSAAMSLAEHANSIAAGVAVSVNSNKAKVQVSDDLNAGGGDLSVTSKLTQNLDGDFAGKLAVQSLAGSASGKDSSVSIGGAISVLVSKAESSVDIAAGTDSARRQLKGDNITVEATDKSRLGARAGGLSLSKGSSVGMGIASSTVVSSNTVEANVGDNTDITGTSFKLNAEKQEITWDDYKNLIDLRYLITDSSKLSEEQRKNANTGLIDIHKGDDDENYKVKVNLSSDKLLQAVDGLNFLSGGQSTYVEAIAGSIMTGSNKEGSKLSLAGSFAVAVTSNKISAGLGNNASVTLTKKNNAGGDMSVTAADHADTRIIAGSFSAAPASASVGATIAVLVASDEVKATTGTNATVNAAGDLTHSAEVINNIQVFTAAMSVALPSSSSSTQSQTAAGGAINVIVSNNKATNTIGDNADITSGGSAKISASATQNLWAISGSANVAAGSKAKYAAGGTINVIVDGTKSENNLGAAKDGKQVKAAKNLEISSSVSDQLISGVASLSVAASMEGKSGAGVVNVIVSRSGAVTNLKNKQNLEATGGDLIIGAHNDAWMLNAGLSVAGSGGTAVGAAFNINVFKRTAKINMTEGTLKAGQDIKVQADGKDTGILASLAASGSVQGSALTGNIIVGVESSTIGTEITKGVTATAGRNALFDTYFSDYTIGAGGNIGISGKGKAVGASILTIVKNNTISTEMGSSTVTGDAAGDTKTKTLTGREIKGVYVGAEAQETQFFGAAGVAIAGTGTAANGEVVVLVNNNTVTADASKAILNAKKNKGSIMVNAKDVTKQTLLAGGISFSGSSSALGAAVVTLVSNKTVDAKAHDMSAYQSIDVLAENNDDISQLAVSAGGSLGGSAVQIGASVLVLKSRARAVVASKVTADYGNFTLKGINNTKLLNVAGAVAATTGSAAVTPVGAVTYFQGEADARLKDGTTVTVTRGNMTIATESKKEVTLITAGISASSGVGISGVANVLVSKDKAYSGAETGATLNVSSGNLDITAENDYKLRSVSGAVGLSKVAVGVNAVVSVMKSNATADLGANTTVGRTLNVKAIANRDVINAAATLAAGQFSGGITVMVLVAGSKMSQDAADMIAYGNSDKHDEKNKTGFDASTFMANAKAAGIDLDTINADESDEDRKLSGDIMAEDLAGNGHYESKQTVGSRQDGQATFDGASGYRKDDIDTKANDDQQDVENRGQMKDSSEAKDTVDIANAKTMNTYTYEDDPDDAVIARIRAGIDVAANTVNVEASQGAAVDMIGAAVAVGQVGVGISTVVAILRSNVSASSMAHITKAAGGVNVKAESKAGKFVGDHDAEDRNEAVGDLLSNKPTKEDASEEDKKKAAEEKKSTLEELKDKLSNRSLRAFSLAVGAGQVGLGVAVSVILTDNVTQAILGGTVENAGDVNVSAKHDYGSVMAATGSLAVGQFAAGASVSVAQANGTVKAIIADDAIVKTNASRDINITTNSNVSVDSIAVTAGGGMGALNAAVALSFNRLNQETGIGEGTTINAGRDITVTSTSATTANNYLLGVTVGGVGISLNAAVANVAAEINTHIGGEKKDSTITAGRNIKVYNDTYSAAIPKVLSVAAGGVAVGGNVLLAFNDTKNFAEVLRSDVTARDLTVNSDLAGEATSSLAALTVGGIAVGLSVNYADMRANNQASVKDSKLTLSGNLNIKTGVGNHKTTSAYADTISANMGLITVGVNAAIARNNAKNYAILHTTRDIKIDGYATIHGYGDSSASASIRGLDIGAASVAVSAVIALNDADVRTDVETKDITVGGKLTLDGTQKATTNAKMKTGGGSLLSLKVSAAMSYGMASSMVKGSFDGKATLKGGYSTTNTGEDDVVADIQNLSFDAISAAARYAAAYSQDLYTTNIQFSGSTTEITGDVDLNNVYNVTTTSRVTPSTCGVDVSLGSLAINAAVAKNIAKANAAFETILGNAHVTGNVKVITTGTVSTDAEIKTAKVKLSGVSVGANIANADMSATQESHLRVGGVLTVDGAVDVQSVANSAKANATIAAIGGESGIELGVANLDISRAIARENMASSATVVGGPVSKATDYQKVDKGQYVTKTVGHFDYDIVVDGKYTVRDDNGVVQKETVYVTTYNTGEREVWNAEGTLIEDTKQAKYDGKRKVKGQEKTPKTGDMVRIGEHFEWVTEEVTEWVKNIVDDPYTVNIYNPDENKLTAASLNIYSGTKENTKTGSTATTRGPLSVGAISAGSLDAKAYSTDSFGIVFEGMVANISGKATLKAATDTLADAQGATPGRFSLVDGSSSEVTAQVGQRGDRQSVNIVIGKGNTLVAGSIDIITENAGNASAWLDQGTSASLGKISKSSQPTDSFYNTLISIGRGATVRATSGDLNITSTDAPKATSQVNTTGFSLTLNFNAMQGKNNIDQENNIDIGASADVAAKGNINIRTAQRTIADAETTMDGGGVLEGSSAVAKNHIYRVARVNVGEDASIRSGAVLGEDGKYTTTGTGTLTLHAMSGQNDNINAYAKVGSYGVVALGNAKAYNEVETHSELLIAQGAKLNSAGKMTLQATSTSFNPSVTAYGSGTRATAIVDSGGLIPAPNTVAKNDLEFVSYIGLNERPANATKVAQRKAVLNSEKGDILVNASNERISLFAYASSTGKGGGGTSNANAWNAANLENAVKIDDTDFTANNIYVYADNGGSLKDSEDFHRASIVSDSFAKLMVFAGKLKPDSRITGRMVNQIRSNDTSSVTWTARNGGQVVHKAASPKDAIYMQASTDYKRIEVLGISLTKADEVSIIKWGYFNRCDFCGEGTQYDVDRTKQISLDKRYEDAFEKVLSPISDIQRAITDRGVITKAWYSDEESYKAAGKIYVLDIKTMLSRDVRLSADRLAKYKLWDSKATQHDVYLLPNAARLYANASGKLQYVVDLVAGDLFGYGEPMDIEIVSALTRNAVAKPVIPIGSTGSLDMKTGIFTIPDSADYQLYLDEVSGAWLTGKMTEGFIQVLIADRDAINSCALEGTELPSGTMVASLVQGEDLTYKDPLTGETISWNTYWIGETPETVQDPDQELILFLYNEAADVADAYRTTRNKLENEEPLTDMSMYMYRDSKADRMGEEKYNVMFFDTPADESSILKCVTTVLYPRELEVPMSLKVVMRAHEVEGADLPVYVLNDHAFIFCDATDGTADVLGGYHVDFDGDTFESNYTKIEGIASGENIVTIKKDQPVWGEWVTDDTAEDIEGGKYELEDDQKWKKLQNDDSVQASDDDSKDA